MAESPGLYIPDEMSTALSVFVQVPIEDIQEIVKRLDGVVTSDVNSFVEKLADDCTLEKATVFAVISTLRNLKQVENSVDMPVYILTAAIGLGLASRGWDAEELGAWEEREEVVQDALGRLTEDSPLMISAKTSALAYARQNVLHRSRIISDIRPIFNEDATDIKSMIVTHSLVLYYSGGDRDQQELHLTMDWNDLKRLKLECERAELKGELIVNRLSECEWKTYLFPETSE
jgi:hypothetical protein